jgi:hypothetical protein
MKICISPLVSLCLLVAGCVPQTPPLSVPTSPSPTGMPTATPQPVASTAPVSSSPSPSMAPSPMFSLTGGKEFGSDSLKGPNSAYHDTAQGQIYVVDVEDPKATTARYGLRRIRQDGTFLSSGTLVPAGGNAPTAVDGLAVDNRGIPILIHRDGDRFRLLKTIGASILPADRYPVFDLPKAGPAALAVAGAMVTVAAVNLDPDKTERTGGSIFYGRGEDDKTPERIYQLPDPLFPTTRMTVTPSGQLFIVGPTRDGKLSMMKVTPDKEVEAVPYSLPAIPDSLWAGPDNDIYVVWNSGSQPARVTRLDANGAVKGESEVRLKDGGYLTRVTSMSFSPEGRALVVGSGFTAGGKALTVVAQY